MNRRSFLAGATLGAAAIPFQALTTRAFAQSGHPVRPQSPGYGPLVERKDHTTGLPLLLLPKGFRYLSFGWTGDPMTNGLPTPGAHDGMAAFPAGPGRTRLVRNHELGIGKPFSSSVYDPRALGGTTTVEFDLRAGDVVNTVDSLSGTIRNCAGGPTPWGSWLTCEETMEHTGMPHGYVFDVPSTGFGDPRPIRDMGRFSHEAVAVDPATGWIYETEDAGNSSGFYRFVPNNPIDLHDGGQLFMLKVLNVNNANLGAGYSRRARFHVTWVPIASPDNPAPGTPANFVWAQGQALGAATFARLEGCWYGGNRIYIVSTSGGTAREGQIWEYNPRNETISLVFESPSAAVLNAPDNITVSPRGGLVLCEDGGGTQFVHGLTVAGDIFPFIKNNVKLNGQRNGISGDFTGSEFAGACYSPDGQFLFVNMQSPGITFAIAGPWGSGAL